jgi:2-oxoglutarate ferredoxin oxidoreductase subunit alpha
MNSSLWKGNLAVVEGAIAGGLDAYFGYPITPQNEITEHMSLRMRQENRVFLQAESELAAINMVLGAAITGKKVMTSSSSPGISLMQEAISYLVGLELPAVIVNIQRGGPGLGNIAGAQGDYFQSVKGGGHGDYRMIVLTPASVQELYDMSRDSFELALKYRNPVMILADGILGQMMEPACVHKAENTDHSVPDYGWNLTGCRGRDSRFIRSLLMEEGDLQAHNYKIWKKFDAMKAELSWEEINTDDAEIILIGYGSCARINLDACRQARKAGIKAGYFRLKTAYPFPSDRLNELAQKADFLVTELSMGQMVEDVKLSAGAKNSVRFYGEPGGGIPEAEQIHSILEDMSK